MCETKKKKDHEDDCCDFRANPIFDGVTGKSWDCKDLELKLLKDYLTALRIPYSIIPIDSDLCLLENRAQGDNTQFAKCAWLGRAGTNQQPLCLGTA